MRLTDSMGDIRVNAPVPGTCPTCAARHDEREPHDCGSLYYQQKFYRLHRRFPTWEDAMAHCSAETQAAWRKKLRKRGIAIPEPEEAGEP